MGWLYMKSLKGHAGPREYLDAQFSFERSDGVSKVLRSELVGDSVYYAAVEQTILETGAHEVFALICLVAYDPRDQRGLHLRLQRHDGRDGALRIQLPRCDPRPADADGSSLRPAMARALPRERRWRAEAAGTATRAAVSSA